MKHKLTSVMAAGALALAVTATTAQASVATVQYFHHSTTAVPCTSNPAGADAGPFSTLAECMDWAPAAAYCLNGSTTYISTSKGEQRFLNEAAANGGTVEYDGVHVYPDFDEDPGDTSDDATVAFGGCKTPATFSGPDRVFLCASHSGTNTMPGSYAFDTAQTLLTLKQTDGSASYWVASAVSGAVAGDADVIGGFTIVCNPKGAATNTFLQEDGSVVDAATKALDDAAFAAGIDAPGQKDTKDYAINA